MQNIYVQFGISLMRLTIGFFLALILGTIIGLAMGISKRVDERPRPFTETPAVRSG